MKDEIMKDEMMNKLNDNELEQVTGGEDPGKWGSYGSAPTWDSVVFEFTEGDRVETASIWGRTWTNRGTIVGKYAAYTGSFTYHPVYRVRLDDDKGTLEFSQNKISW